MVPGLPYPSFHLVVIEKIRFDFVVIVAGLESRLASPLGIEVQQLANGRQHEVLESRISRVTSSRRGYEKAREFKWDKALINRQEKLRMLSRVLQKPFCTIL